MPSCPLFQDISLDLEAVEGGYLIKFLKDDDSIIYKEHRPSEPWSSKQIQAELGNRLYDNLPEHQQKQLKKEWVKEQVENVLQTVDSKLETDEELQASLQSPAVKKVIEKTESVDLYPSGEKAVYVITIEGKKFEFTANDIHSGPRRLQNLWLAKFHEKIKLNGEDWEDITDAWIAQQTVHKEEMATEDSLLIESLLSYFTNSIHAFDSKEALQERRHAWFDTDGDYLQDADPPVLWIGADDIKKGLTREGEDPGKASKLSKELRQGGHLLEPSRKLRIGEKTVRAWPFDPEAVGVEEEDVSSSGEKTGGVEI